MLSQVVINQGNFALQNRAENVVQTVVHCFSITSSNKLKINKMTPLLQSPLGSPVKAHTIDYQSYEPFFFFAISRIRATPQAWRLNQIDDANSSLIKAIQ